MLLRVGLDPEAGTEIASGQRPPRGALIRLLKERCVLSVDSASSAAELLRAFSGCGSPSLAEAVAALATNPSRTVVAPVAAEPKPVPIADMLDAVDAQTWSALADLILVSIERADCLGEPAAPEVATLRTALDTAAFDEIDQLWKTLVLPGQRREDVWKSVFAPLAARPCDVYVVDRWAPISLFNGLTATTTAGHKAGAEWFLGALARSRVRRVRIACSRRYIREKRLDPTDLQGAISNWWAGMGTKTILEMKLVEGDFDHGRGIAFDGWAGFSPHNGLASFDRPEITERVALHADRALADDLRHAYGTMRPAEY